MAIPKKSQQLQELETHSVLSAFMLVLYLFQQRQAFIYAALGLLAIGLFVRPLARLISGVWLKFAELLGAFNSKIILSLVFYLFLTPLAFIFRLFAKNPLQLKSTRDTQSVYQDRNHLYSREDFEKMW